MSPSEIARHTSSNCESVKVVKFLYIIIIAEHLSARQLIRECSEISTLVCIYIYRNAIIKRMTTGTLIRRPRVLSMAYCSNVETSEGATARLRRLATLRKRSKVQELQKSEQKQRDLDESERQARQSRVC